MTEPITLTPPAGRLVSVLRLLRRHLRLFVSTSPALYTLYARLLNLKFRLSPNSQIVIESYPRSGNSFFESAFERASGGALEVAHHSHAAAQVLAGLKRGLPCVVLVRKPEAAIASFFEMNGGIYPIPLCTREYVVFYRALLPVIDRLMVIETDQIEARFADLMVLLRDRHGLALTPYTIDAQTRSALFADVDAKGQIRNGFARQRYSESMSDAEKAARRDLLDRIRRAIAAPGNAADLAEAQALFARFKAAADALPVTREGAA